MPRRLPDGLIKLSESELNEIRKREIAELRAKIQRKNEKASRQKHRREIRDAFFDSAENPLQDQILAEENSAKNADNRSRRRRKKTEERRWRYGL